MKIRSANNKDIESIHAIYEYYVLNTYITFEYDVPSLDEMRNRMVTIQKKYPYLVAEVDGQIAGYTYATDFRYRSAYQWSPECTIYIDKDFQRKGIGRVLYEKLFECLRQQGFYNVFGGVALPNEKSVAIHLKCGFEEIGIFKNIGYKHGKWHSTQWFQLVLNQHRTEPKVPLEPQIIMIT